jgi:hypothetical protein
MGKRNVSEWNRKGVMMGYILLTMVVYLSCWIMPLSAIAMTLHTHGNWDVSCSTGFLESHKFDKTTSKNTYHFIGPCTESAGTYVGNRRYSIDASWDGSTQTAMENLSAAFSPQGLGTRTDTISYTCPDDPWINTVNCTITSKTGDIFGLEMSLTQPIKYPISANFLSSSQKKSLKGEWATKGAYMATPQAPVILHPNPNQQIKAPAIVLIKVQHNPTCNLALEFQRHDLIDKQTKYSYLVKWYNQQVVLSNKQVHAGITTGYLSIDKPGDWRVRAQCIFPNAPWSEWTEFVVK